MKKPILITCQPDDTYFSWQVHLYVESSIEVGFLEENIHVLLFKPQGRYEWNPIWDKLQKTYPKLKIFKYDDKGITNHIKVYIPILRPHILWQHFEKHPELEKETIVYTDCDILWTKDLDIEKYFDDDINYISYAGSYLDHKYFERKMLDMREGVSTDRDFFNELCKIVGIEKSKAVENEKNIGGVQYILKGVNAEFWKKVEKDCMLIRKHLQSINEKFYENENKGIQSWCSDLWAVLFNLWFFEKEVKTVPELNFAWSSDPISKLEGTGILHNAGITGKYQGETPVFYKGFFHRGQSPFDDPHVIQIADMKPTLCNHVYVQELFKLKQKYNP